MAIILSANEGSGYTPIEEGTYVASCFGLVDIGDEYSEQYDKASPKFMILWELVGAGTTTVDGKERNRFISKTYTKAFSPKANIRKDLRAWRGREFTDEELKAFDMVNILGAPCQIQIINTSKDGKTYSNMGAIMNLPKGMPKPHPTHDTLYWDFQECAIGDAEWERLPQWIRNKIEASETYQFITSNNTGHLTDRRIEEIMEYKAFKDWRAANGASMPVDDKDEGLPF